MLRGIAFYRFKISDALRRLLGRQPDLYLLGEHHKKFSHNRFQAAAIRYLRSELVVTELANDMNPEDAEPEVESYEDPTLEGFARASGLEVADLGITEEFIQRLIANHRKARDRPPNLPLEGEVVPTNYDDLMLTPIYRLPFYIFHRLEQRILGTVAPLPPTDQRTIDQVNEHIRWANGYERFARITYYHRPSRTRILWAELFQNLGEIRNCAKGDSLGAHIVLEAMYAVGSAMAGCDFCERTKRSYDDQDQETLEWFEKTNAPREKRMGHRLVCCMQIRKRLDTPVIGIVGAEHVQPHSKIHKILSDSGIRYHAIDLDKFIGD